jgi:hypothetical protein
MSAATSVMDGGADPNDFDVFINSCGGAFGGTCPPPTSFDINGALGGLQAGV